MTRQVATDATQHLGTILNDTHKRDAIHLAVIPVKLKSIVQAGDHLSADGQFMHKGDSRAVGIADPFLDGYANVDDIIYLVIYPGKITSLRHVWEHEAFPEQVQISFDAKAADVKELLAKIDKEVLQSYVRDNIPFTIPDKQISKDWLTAWLSGLGYSYLDDYDEFIDMMVNVHLGITEGKGWIYRNNSIIMNNDAYAELTTEVYFHLENVLGYKLNVKPIGIYCSC